MRDETGGEILFTVTMDLSVSDLWPQGNAPDDPTKEDALAVLLKDRKATRIAVNRIQRYSPMRFSNR